MYKIYINDTPLFLVDKVNANAFLPGNDKNLVAAYRGKRKMLLNYANMLEHSPHYESIVLYAEDVEALFEDFKSHYKFVEAAGGVVYNEDREVLLIYRLGNWDLPKGKMEEGETRDVSALREVIEETGIEDVKLENYILTSYHTYFNRKGKRCLKPTYWYRMFTHKQNLTPQTEEDIEKAVWKKLDEFLDAPTQTYQSIRSILAEELKISTY